MDYKKLSAPLKPEDVELRVGSVFKGGYATLLTYKTARTDVARLNEALGAENWTNTFFYNSKNILSCKIGIWNDSIKAFVYKEDVGTDSFTEKEKGSHSDAFKRAGFKLGIGDELYKIKNIFIKLNQDEFYMEGSKAKATNKLKVNLWKFEYKGSNITITDTKGVVRFNQRYDFVDSLVAEMDGASEGKKETFKPLTLSEKIIKLGIYSNLATCNDKITEANKPEYEALVKVCEALVKVKPDLNCKDYCFVMKFNPLQAVEVSKALSTDAVKGLLLEYKTTKEGGK